MRFAMTEHGHLEIVIETDDDREMIKESMEKASHADHSVIADLMETYGWTGNGQLYQVRPECIGALTDAPILSDEVEFDDGAQKVTGNVWWFPNYQVESFVETLLTDGRVVFTKAPEIT